MWIKRASPRPVRLRLPRRRLPLLLLGLALVGGLCLASVYQGMMLVKSGRSMELSDWVGGIARSRLGVIPNALGGLTARPERLEIDLAFEQQQRLAWTRERALAEGQLFSEEGDWVPAEIHHQGHKYAVEMRLKGDLSDHWRRPDFWSYKVKVKGDHTLLGMKRFALQDPRTRKYMNEWVAQRMLGYLGLIALRYEFVDVSINGVDQPVYALEENFEKRLIEHNRRREGPILRYDQWFYWKHDPGLAPELAGSSVTAYQEDDIVGTEAEPALELARTLLELYRRGEAPASEVFDVELMARYFAMIELLGYDHAAGIDNLKFYYNPITSRFEPVGYDFNHMLPIEELVVARILPAAPGSAEAEDWRHGLFTDRTFLEHYVAALGRLSEASWLQGFFDSVHDDFESSLKILHRSNPWYEFDGREVLAANQAVLRAFLHPERALQAYLGSGQDGRLELEISNVHTLPIEILALEWPDGTSRAPLQPTVIDGYREDAPLRYTSVPFPLDGALPPEAGTGAGLVLRCRFLGSDSDRLEPVNGWRPTREEFLVRELREPSDLGRFEFLARDEARGVIRFLPGRWSLHEPLVLPAGQEILAGEGTELDLLEGAVVVSYSPLSWVGSEGAPVRLGSSDGTGQGLVVLAGGRSSTLQWVEFNGLGSLASGGWSQTGAVTFYESPVEASHCRFAGPRSEDGLNVVRTRFLLQGCSFVDTHSDAFDADFCEGRILDSLFLRPGNDAIDVSGSRVEIANVSIDGCRDKGVSVGENSHCELRDSRVRASEIALASKDRSELTASGIEIENCRVGVAVFEKKPEFGQARVAITGLRIEGAEHVHLVERGSILTIDGQQVEPIEGKVEDLLYGKQYGISSH